MQIEETIGIEVTDDDMAEMRTVKDAIDLAERKTKVPG